MVWYNGLMKLYYDKNSKDPTYFIQKGYRNGTKTTTKNIGRIGKHSELLKITDDPLAYAKAEVAKANAAEKENNKITMEVTVDFDEKIKATSDPASSTLRQNIGYLFLQKIYNQLHLDSFFKKATAGSKIEFDANLINRFLTYDRILNPGSKRHSCMNTDWYYERPEFTHKQVLKMMDVLEKNYDQYISHLFTNSNNIVKRNTSVCYYDCSNFYTEIESEDLDYVDEVTGEYIRGLRKYGVSKEHRNTPIVEMGLFMDSDGIPLSMCIEPGSTNEQTTAIPSETELLKMIDGKRIVYVADAGLGSFHIRNFNAMGGRAFVVTQSIKKMSDVMKQAVFNDYDYRRVSNNASASLEYLHTFDRHDENNLELYKDRIYKVIDADRAIDLGLTEVKYFKNGNSKIVKSKGLLKQRIIITFSRKDMEYQRYIRNRQIERASEMIENLDPETYKKGPHDITRFIKRTSATKEGEKADDYYALDMERIQEEEKYDGFYAIATNLDEPVQKILEICANRYKIEDCFRVMKTNLDARPIYHQKRNRIKAHFMICYTALLIYRLLEAKLDRNKTHVTTDDLINTLKTMEVVNVDEMYYMSTYTGSKALSALCGAMDLDLEKKRYQPKELNRKCKKI